MMRDKDSSTSITFGIGPYRTVALAILVIALGLLWNVILKNADDPFSTPIVLAEEHDSRPASPSELQSPPPSNGRRFKLGFVGDIMQHRGQAEDDFSASYAQMKPIIETFDLAVGNLEFPVYTDLPLGPPPQSVQFNGSASHVAALADAGFDVLCTANNHAFDQGIEGVVATLDVIEEQGIVAVGTSGEPLRRPTVVDLDGLRLALVGYTFYPNSYPEEDGTVTCWPREWPIFELNFFDWNDEYRQKGVALFKDHVAKAQVSEADLLVALVHWGEEWHFQPSEDQRRAAHDMIDSGFDLVVGGHAHVLNPPEVYRGKLIAYSLGNFISDFAPMEARLGAVLEVVVARGMDEKPSVVDFKYIPVLTQRTGHVVHPLQDNNRGNPDSAWTLAERILGPSIADLHTDLTEAASQPSPDEHILLPRSRFGL